MIGNFKIFGILVTLLLLGCKKENEIRDSRRELIIQNINVLIDSVESFDTSKMPAPPVSNKDFKKYKPVKLEQIRIGLLDSVFIENNESFNYIDQKKNQLKSFTFKLQESDLVNFKSNYTIKLVKVNNYDSNILFVNFSNFYMTDNEANIDVKKNIGISMIKERYYFIKRNSIWVFKKKKILGMG